MAERKRSGKDSRGGHGVPVVQWVVSGIALLVVLASFALVAYQGLNRDQAAPSLTVAVDSVVQDANGYRVHVTVQNRGGTTAANVQVQAELTAGDVAETGVLEIDYVPPDAHTTGAFHFSTDPRRGNLQARVTGFLRP